MGLEIGITKKALLEDYYLDEIGAIFEAHREMRKTPDEQVEYVDDPNDFFDKLGV